MRAAAKRVDFSFKKGAGGKRARAADFHGSQDGVAGGSAVHWSGASVFIDETGARSKKPGSMDTRRAVGNSYQFRYLLISPGLHADRADVAGIGAQGVPGVAARVDDDIKIGKDTSREPDVICTPRRNFSDCHTLSSRSFPGVRGVEDMAKITTLLCLLILVFTSIAVFGPN
jgi:hypothetical protein